MQNKPLSRNCSTPTPSVYHTQKCIFMTECIELKALSSLSLSLSLLSVSLSLSLSQSVCCQHVKLNVGPYQLWQLPGQGGWHWTRSAAVHCLHLFSAALLVSRHSFACGTDPHFAAQHSVAKDTAENSGLWFFCSSDGSSEPVPFTSSEPLDHRLPTQEGKETIQEAASTCKSPRSSQAPSLGIQKVVLLAFGLAQNSAVGARGRILTR